MIECNGDKRGSLNPDWCITHNRPVWECLRLLDVEHGLAIQEWREAYGHADADFERLKADVEVLGCKNAAMLSIIQGTQKKLEDANLQVESLRKALDEIASFANRHAPSFGPMMDVLRMCANATKPWAERRHEEPYKAMDPDLDEQA